MCCLFALICMGALLQEAVPLATDNGEPVFYGVKKFKMPKSCKNKDMEFCFDDENYPLNILNDMIKDVDALEISNEVVKLEDTNSSNPVRYDQPDCSSDATNDPIYYIVDENGQDRVVVQLKGKFQQRLSVMWCEKEGRPTRASHFLDSTLQEYSVSCENKYINHSFLVLSLKPNIHGNYKLEWARAKSGIPVCCACKYQSTY
ncbi:uncharacterized protein LOC142980628 [Anticarsia gemmatalis]|uniref:uncharacterized protein LOC142980628 n=1 Tax=Anticarsia gemmatalis TaxID=129554 RepID=UPI003F767AA3